MFAALDISTSALVAQRTRLTAISNNMANVSTTRNEQGIAEPYQPRYVVFESDPGVGGAEGAAGVRVAGVHVERRQPIWKYEPGHPDAIQDGPRRGMVAYPNVDITREFVDALEATRAYEANLGVIDVTKDLARRTLDILA
jgi:flagellar basal-body rod protein FlgC